MARMASRHVTERPVVQPYTDTDGWSGSFGAPVQLHAQAEHTQQIVTDKDGARVVSVLTLRIPGRSTADVATVCAPGARVDYDGTTSYILSIAPVRRHGVVQFWRVLTGELPPKHDDGYTVTAVVHHGPGLDLRGNYVPSTGSETYAVAVFRTGSTSEPVDESDQAITTGTLLLQAAAEVTSTATVQISGHPALAGWWQVDGDPSPVASRLEVPLRRS